MIVIPRDVVRRFRALARKCLSTRPKGPAPPVVAQVRSGTLVLWVRTAQAGLRYTATTTGEDETIVMPMDVLATVEAASPDPVQLSVSPELEGTATWTNRGLPQTYPFVAILPGQQHEIPDLPDKVHSVPESFLTALHECARIAALESTRFALDRVQVRGKTGQVIGTDSKEALLWGGFKLPFSDDLLLPAIPVFGTRGLASAAPVPIGRTSDHLVVMLGPWSVFLPFMGVGRYPDVASVVPRSYSASVAGIDDHDAEALAEAMARWPASPDEENSRPVTLEVDGGVRVRCRDKATDKVCEMRLERSTFSGPAVQVALPRHSLARALELGCLTARITGSSKPVAFEGPDRLFLSMCLDTSCIVSNEQTPRALPEPVPRPPEPIPERSIPVKSDEGNGRSPNGRAEPPPPDGFDLLVEAEAPRSDLVEAATRAARLVSLLKNRKKEQKALASVWSSLKSLNLGP